jgi:hypothetical protein
MGVKHIETCIKKSNQKRTDEEAFRSAVRLLFTQSAENGEISNEVITSHASVLLPWAAEAVHAKGCIRRDPVTDVPYLCTEPPPKTKSKIKPPSEAVEHWQAIEG